VKTSTIKRCFTKGLKSTTTQLGEVEKDATHDIEIGLQRLQESSHIRNIMDINQFLNLTDENIEDSLEELDENILAKYDPDIEAESDEEVETLPQIGQGEALDALYKLRLYEERQDTGPRTLLEALSLSETLIRRRQVDERIQMDIRSYFSMGDSI